MRTTSPTRLPPPRRSAMRSLRRVLRPRPAPSRSAASPSAPAPPRSGPSRSGKPCWPHGRSCCYCCSVTISTRTPYNMDVMRAKYAKLAAMPGFRATPQVLPDPRHLGRPRPRSRRRRQRLPQEGRIATALPRLLRRPRNWPRPVDNGRGVYDARRRRPRGQAGPRDHARHPVLPHQPADQETGESRPAKGLILTFAVLTSLPLAAPRSSRCPVTASLNEFRHQATAWQAAQPAGTRPLSRICLNPGASFWNPSR